MLDQIGYPYSRFEEMGYMSPVLHADCEYKKSVKFDDEVKIVVSLQDFGTENVYVLCGSEGVHRRPSPEPVSGRRAERVRNDYPLFPEQQNRISSNDE